MFTTNTLITEYLKVKKLRDNKRNNRIWEVKPKNSVDSQHKSTRESIF